MKEKLDKKKIMVSNFSHENEIHFIKISYSNFYILIKIKKGCEFFVYETNSSFIPCLIVK